MSGARDDDDPGNRSGKRTFRSVVRGRLTRRAVLQGGLAAAATVFLRTSGAAANAARTPGHGAELVGFEPVPKARGTGPWPTVSPDYQWQVLIPWGEPLDPDGPPYRHPPTPDDQARQIGIGHDGLWYFPILDPSRPRGGWPADREWDDARDWHHNVARHPGGNTLGLLAVNHEFGSNARILGHKRAANLAQVRTSQHAHGVSVVGIAHVEGRWQTVASPYARRVHVNTPVAFSGPAAGSPRLVTPAGNPPLGTLNNCAIGYTPWGTYLTCEENFHGYFGATDREHRWSSSRAQKRYGFRRSGLGYGWHRHDPRFDLSNPRYRNEENRFGWVVEIDPYDAQQVPVKRTALGRMKHEGVALTVGRDGRVVGYMGDDERFDYIYKFVSGDHWKAMRARGESPLDHGRLFVARFNDDGSGDWLELSVDNPVLANVFEDQGDLLIHTRLAADLLDATPMDRPEWTTVAPNGDVYCTLTENYERIRANAANPRAPNPSGHILRWRDADAHVGTTFEWDIFLVAASLDDTEQALVNPDGLWADPDGRLFIQTDGEQEGGLNNQLVVADPLTGTMRRLFTGVPGDELAGIATTPDRRTLFINIQHPGKGDPARTNFPALPDGTTAPRDATVVITRKDGGIVGS